MCYGPRKEPRLVKSKTILLIYSIYSYNKITHHDEKRNNYTRLLRDFDSVKNITNLEDNSK